jgi:ABC-2 type transport system permease protein
MTATEPLTSPAATAPATAPSRRSRPRSSPLPLATVAFARKEASDVLRQPRLLLTLVLGPFLILLAFGLGYRDEVRPFRTLFVGNPDSALGRQLEASAQQLGPMVRVVGLTGDEAGARRRLADGGVDAVVLLPDDPLDSVRHGQRATLRILHDRLDPVELSVIGFASRLAVAQLNATVLARVVGEGQAAGAPVADLLQGASAAVGAALGAVDAGDAKAADQKAAELADGLRGLEAAALAAEALGPDASSSPSSTGAAPGSLAGVVGEARRAVATAREQLQAGRVTEARAALVQAQGLLARAPEVANDLMSVDADVLVQPFRGDVQALTGSGRTFTDYYAPAAIVLLLQQFGVAFAALTFVRERQQGAAELYRVSPVRPHQVVVGKYIGHLVIGALVAAALTALVTAVLGVPIAGSVAALALALGLVVLASIGLGFLISLTSPTDMQAVLSTMLLLLAALFFSGFFLSIDQLSPAARVISWALPATYGIELVRDVMLRGADLDAQVTAGLAVYGGVLVLVVLALTARRMSVRT